MILPITHENMASRRWPFVTIAIIAACLLTFLATRDADDGHAEEIASRMRTAGQYWQAHPYLHAESPIDRLPSRVSVKERALFAPDQPGALAAEQAYLDERVAELREAIAQHPARRFGFVPSERNWLGLVTSMFMHGGWLHLIFNMWFLWLSGCNLEDRWGRAVFTGFYASAGIAASLVHFASAPDSSVAVVGASGAIAGAMGAFLVAFGTTRIRFLLMLGLRPRLFTAPAYVMLPLWGLQELLYGSLVGAKDGVAHWAHVGGFGFGVLFALALRWGGIEARLDEAVEGKVSKVQDPRIARAAELTSSGRPADALAMLDALASQRPKDIDVRFESLRAAKVAGDRRREGVAYGSLVGLFMADAAFQTAYELFSEAFGVGLADTIPVPVRVQLAEHYVRESLPDRAWLLYSSVTHEGLRDDVAVQVALAQAGLARATRRTTEGRALLEAILESPFSTSEMDGVARAQLEELDDRRHYLGAEGQVESF